jgi:hypothetical protein
MTTYRFKRRSRRKRRSGTGRGRMTGEVVGMKVKRMGV